MSADKQPVCGAFLASQPRGNYTPGARRCKRPVAHEGDRCHQHEAKS